MDSFTKQVSGVYNLVHNFEYALDDGELIRSYNVYIDDVLSTTADVLGYETSGIILSHEKYDNNTILIDVQNGLHGSGYEISTVITSNRSNVYSRNVELNIDDDNYPDSYNNFDYRYYTSKFDRSIYIVPNKNKSFSYNQQYDISVLPGLSGYFNYTMSTSYNTLFTTQYCPLFASITTIKLMGGPVIETFTDDSIYRLINKNSKDIVDIFNAGNNSSYNYYSWGCTPEGVPYNLRRYVECKTTYDLLIIDEVQGGNPSTSQRKHLGDMDIAYGGKASTSSSDSDGPSLKKQLFDCFNSIINLYGNTMKVAVVGRYDVSKGYPHPVADPCHNRVTKRNYSPGPWNKGYTRGQF